ncbi:MAG: ribonuclease P protein component [Patescibacteria group bacterium]
MLSKKNRITRAEFESILSKGKRYHSPIFTLYVVQSKNAVDKKFAFSVSKKVARGAVQRNKLRRQGYATLRTIVNSTQPGFLYLFIYKKTPKTPSYKEIKENITSLLGTSFVVV